MKLAGEGGGLWQGCPPHQFGGMPRVSEQEPGTHYGWWFGTKEHPKDLCHASSLCHGNILVRVRCFIWAIGCLFS